MYLSENTSVYNIVFSVIKYAMGFLDLFKSNKVALPSPDEKKSFSLFMPIVDSSVPDFSSVKYKDYALEGYLKNPVVYSCVEMVAKSLANIPFRVFDKNDREVKGHPGLSLLGNVFYGDAKFQEHLSDYEFKYRAASFLLLSGSCFILANLPKRPTELQLLNPLDVQVDLEKGEYRLFDKIYTPEMGQLIHIKGFHPTIKGNGASPIGPCIQSISQNNAARAWNLATLRRKTKVSGFLRAKTGPMTEKNRDLLRKEIDNNYSGPNNTGKTMVLPDGLEFDSTEAKATDMDWKNVIMQSASEIGLAFGVSDKLLSNNSGSTQEIREHEMAMFLKTVIPLGRKITSIITRELPGIFVNGQKLTFSLDDIEVIQLERQEAQRKARHSKAKTAGLLFKAGIIDRDEARAIIGLEADPSNNYINEQSEELAPETDRQEGDRSTDQ